MNRGIVNAARLVRMQLQKEATVGGVVRGAGRAVRGARRAWNEGATSVGRSVSSQMRAAGKSHAGLAGRATSGALKLAPVAGLGYLGYRAFEPEVHSAKRRLGNALRGRVALFKARRRAVMPYYHEGRFQ